VPQVFRKEYPTEVSVDAARATRPCRRTTASLPPHCAPKRDAGFLYTQEEIDTFAGFGIRVAYDPPIDAGGLQTLRWEEWVHCEDSFAKLPGTKK
jgi:hypothetical protein